MIRLRVPSSVLLAATFVAASGLASCGKSAHAPGAVDGGDGDPGVSRRILPRPSQDAPDGEAPPIGDGEHGGADAPPASLDSATEAGRAADGPPVSLEQACAELAGNYCERLVSCQSLWTLRAAFGTQTACALRIALWCRQLATAPDLSVAPMRIADCGRDLGESTCADIAAGRSFGECFWQGKRGANQVCADDHQCESGFCRIQDRCGVCTPRAATGAPCVRDRQCADGLFCSQQTHACTPLAVSAGAQCVGLPNSCQRPLKCGSQRTCVVPGPAGAPCATDDDCDAGIFCARAAGAPRGVCQSVGYSAIGGPCGGVAGVPTYCLGGGVCAPDAAAAYRCVAVGADNQPCVNGACLWGASCIGGTCRLPEFNLQYCR